MSESVDIFFAFPDGALSYHCATCDQRCCKSGRLPVFPADKEALLRIHPALELVGSPHPEPVDMLTTPPSGCWFLQRSSCSLLRDGDVEMNTRHTPPRPSFCTVYPFTLYGWLEGTLVVAPTARCPLRVASAGGITHAQVTDVISRLGLPGLPPPQLRPSARGTLPLERAVRDAARASLLEPSPVPLIAFTQLATAAFLRGDLDGLELGELPAALDHMHRRLDEMSAIIGVAPIENHELAAVAPMLAAFTSALRLFAWGSLPLAYLPESFLALAVYAAHWQRARPERALEAASLMQMSQDLGATCALLARWHRPWACAHDDVLALPTGTAPAEHLRAWSEGTLPLAELATRAAHLRRLGAALMGSPA